MDIITPSSNDFGRLLAIWEASVRATHAFLCEQAIQELMPVVLAGLEEVELYGAVDEQGTLCGFIGVVHDKIEMLFVHPQSFKQGCGKALIRHVEAKQKIRYVDVNEQNPQALAFYTHMGFTRRGRSAHDEQGRDFPILHLEHTQDSIPKITR